MVSTRNHPKNFPPPDVSPAKSGASSSSAAASPTPSSGGGAQARKRRSQPNRRLVAPGSWSHASSHLTLVWLLISLPLVAWDTGYVLLRPLTMPGGALFWPVWEPYGLYGTIDYMYGWPAWETHNGFTGAQSWMNIAESLLYVAYLYIILRHGHDDGRVSGRGASKKFLGWLGQARIVVGAEAGPAAVIGFTASVMTVSKTVLYILQEACSGWAGVGHNDPLTLLFLWIIPNGSWIVVPGYMTYIFGAEILEGLAVASGAGSSAPRAIKDE